jgi:hypothetical protein
MRLRLKRFIENFILLLLFKNNRRCEPLIINFETGKKYQIYHHKQNTTQCDQII